MKRVLFLLFITINAFADVYSDLEHAVLKSDLPKVEQILADGTSLSAKDQIALINLATEIIRKRENKIALNTFELARPHPENNITYLKNNKKLRSTGIKVGVFLIGSVATFFAGGGICGASIDRRGSAKNLSLSCGIGLLTVSALSFIGMLFYLGKHEIKKAELIEKKKARYNDRYNSAIKIRQCLFRMKPQENFA